MKPEDKELLLKDLSARLPYGVICTDSRHGDSEITEIDTVAETVYCNDFDEYVELDKCKPYLRPLSSMTEEEKKELLQISNFNSDVDDICYDSICCIERTTINITDIANFINWLNAHHFDYQGLIEKGLAFEAPEYMYMHLKI